MASRDLIVRILGNTSSFDKAMGDTSKSLTSVGSSLTKTLTPAAAAVGVAFGKMGADYNAARNAIIAGTGASGDALDELMGVAKTVGSRVPQDLGQVGVAVADVNTRLGLTGPELENVSKKALDLSRVTGEDLQTTIRATARMTKDWGRDSAEAGDIMDMLYSASQQTGIGVGTLGDKITQFGAPLRQLGFSMEEATALLAGFEAQGVNTDTVMAGLRAALGKVAKAGEEPIDTFRRVTDEIKHAGTAGEANAIALELFGQRAGPDMAAAIREGRFEVDELVASLADSSGSIDDAAKRTLTLSDRLAMFRNRVTGALGPFGEFGAVAGGAVASIGPLLFGLGQMGPLLAKVRAGFVALRAAMMAHPIIAMATIAVGVATAIAAIGSESYDSTARVDELARAMRDAGDAADGLDTYLRQILDDGPTLTAVLDKAGITLDELQAAAAAGGDQLEVLTGRVHDTAKEMGLSSVEALGLTAQVGTLNDVYTDSIERNRALASVTGDTAAGLDELGGSAGDAGDQVDEFGNALDDAADGASTLEQAVERLKREQDRQRAQTEANQRAIDNLIEAHQALVDAQRAEVDSTYAARAAERDFARQVERTTAVLNDAESTTHDVEGALDDLALSAGRSADGQVKLAQDTAAARGASLTQKQQLDITNAALLAQAATTNGPLRAAILEYVARLNKIPDEVVSDISAALDRGDIDDAEWLLNQASRQRTAVIRADALTGDAEYALNQVARQRQATVTAVWGGTIGNAPRPMARGGRPHYGETALVGEEGPELVTFGGGRPEVHPTDETARMLGAGGARVTNNHYTTINLPAGANPDAVVRAQRRYERRNGRSGL